MHIDDTVTYRQILDTMHDLGGQKRGEILNKVEHMLADAKDNPELTPTHALLMTFAQHMAQGVEIGIKSLSDIGGRYRLVSRALDTDGDVVMMTILTDNKRHAMQQFLNMTRDPASISLDSIVSETITLADTAEGKIMATGTVIDRTSKGAGE